MASRYVADKYRKAAVLLDDAATEVEDDATVMTPATLPLAQDPGA